ncbi:MAG: aminotransferase class I/II-fold pyridoxal phosphate-dependent enzyme [Ignavibacteria bacterium]|nr:aminotransferase class I/II-fold pyridoxal phosphate-dependent enzyme [Ignavibacteria bacterium]
MFSSRLPADLSPNPLARLLEKKREAEIPVIDLTESNPTRAGFRYPEAEILRALANPASMVYEPQPRGLQSAREAVAAHFAMRGFAVDPERMHLTASTSEAYAMLLKLLTDHGDMILVPRPSYPLVEYLAALEFVQLLPFDLRYGERPLES